MLQLTCTVGPVLMPKCASTLYSDALWVLRTILHLLPLVSNTQTQ
jgi:hypothetical protein